MYQERLRIATEGRGSYEITAAVARCVGESRVRSGLCHVFVAHTSASLMICENADPAVRRDLERYFAQLVPDGDPMFEHSAEGADDMPAHIRSILTQPGVTVPVSDGRLGLGTWQGLFLWEHRYQGHERVVTVTVQG